MAKKAECNNYVMTNLPGFSHADIYLTSEAVKGSVNVAKPNIAACLEYCYTYAATGDGLECTFVVMRKSDNHCLILPPNAFNDVNNRKYDDRLGYDSAMLSRCMVRHEKA